MATNFNFANARQSVFVTPPRAEAGYRTAKVVVINEYGQSEAIDFTYPENYCDEISSPTIEQPPTDKDLEDAYQDCLDDVADLFCEPAESAVPTSAYISAFSSNQENILIGEPLVLQYEIRIDEGPIEYNIVLRNRTIISEGESSNSSREELPSSWTSKIKDIGVFELLREETGNLGSIRYENRQFDLPPNTLPGDELEIYISISSEIVSQGERVEIIDVDVGSEPLSPGLDSNAQVQQQVNYSPSDDNDFSDGKKEIYISVDTVANINSTIDDYERDYINNFSSDQVGNFFPNDKFREFVGSFWIRENTSDSMIWASDKFKNIMKPMSEKIKTYDLSPSSPAFKEQNKNRDFISYEDTFYFSREYSEKLVQNNIKSLSADEQTPTIKDINYVLQKPYTPKESKNINLPFNSRILDVKPVYNYYNRRYEEKHYLQDERLLPNMYYLLLNDLAIKTAKTEDERDDYEIDPQIKKLIRLRKHADDGIGPLKVNSYYDYYVANIGSTDIEEGGMYTRIGNGERVEIDVFRDAKDIVIPYSFLKTLDDSNERTRSFPMFIDIKFDTSPLQFVGRLLKDSYDGERFLLQMIDDFKKSREVEEQDMYKIEYNGDSETLFSAKARILDFKKSFFSETELQNTRDDQFAYLGNYKDYKKTPKLYRKSISLESEIERIIRLKARTYEKILENRKCYQETLFYRISKYNYTQTQNGEQVLEQEPIQNIYIPNDPDKNYLRYIDTQVKYNKKYLYRIYSYDFILHNEHRTRGGQTSQITNIVTPSVIENLYDEFDARVNDRPPVIPEVNIESFKEVDNKILFRMNKGTSTYKAKEISILEEDELSFQKVRESQKLEENELIEFSGDDTIKKYQILKTRTAPKSYKDFADADVIEIDTSEGMKEPHLRTTASTYVDIISPNVKYYYTVRCIDVHKQISNPGLVYEVEIINENGMIFPIIRQWEFPKPNNKTPSKSFKRFLMIQPNVLQTKIRIDDSAEEDMDRFVNDQSKITIGSGQEAIWNKKYKLRLVSKNTKKIYDIKFSFDTNKQIIE